MRKYIYFIVIFFFVFTANSFGQSLPVGSAALEDYYRRAQLAGKLDSTVSFTVRPIIPKSAFGIKDMDYPDSTETRYNLFDAERSGLSKYGKFKWQLLPLGLLLQSNSHHPYGWNDGAMIPAKGLQTLLTGGIYAEYGPLTIQFKPEILLAANSTFETFDKEHYDVITARYYDFYNNIDLPARFGGDGITKAYWGQSSIRLNYKALSFGLSTENLWWGPGMRNSLLMSNNAPGFKHLTLNTRRPIQSAIGSFEGQIIAGRLEESGYGVLVPEREYFNQPLYVAKPNDWRYLSGLVLTWQPKWVPCLFLGLTRSAQHYSTGLNSFGDYLPFFSSKKQEAASEAINKRDQRNSYFMRWLWAEEKAEVYLEFGRNNYSGNLNDLALEPNVSRAYIFGIRKLFPFDSRVGENLMLSVEVTQMQETDISKVLNLDSWYTSKSIRHGYTNRGQILGAGIGPGANHQSIELSWVKGFKRLGFQVERLVHNNDFYYYAFNDSKDFRRHWTDLSFGASGEWNYKNFLFNAKLQGIQSLNYQWFLMQQPGEDYMVPGKDVFNLQIQMGVTYRF
ncbi:capsule assembly Wzi family protein [Pedobacter aquatilis]|uniref:capsule assembly Wzi family protein n=1 Tax=Pedobacter aquatilis TaxID=351343 RepID=UPI0029313752|nr:capsule assembly Wzi family protein [Pedobacter aquatilis]